MATKQDVLDNIHEDLKQMAQLWVSGLITDREITNSFRKCADLLDTLEVVDLLDPATGLRYEGEQA
jgi:hypothetical protein